MNRFISHFLLATASCLVTTAGAAQNADIERLLDDVDNEIARSADYEQEKLRHIDYIKSQLSTAPTDLDRYEINRRLFLEYEPMVCDSALLYVNANIKLAEKAGLADKLNESLIDKAAVFSKAGLFNETLQLLSTIDPSNLTDALKARYFLCYSDVYQFLIEYEGEGEYCSDYRAKANAYKDSIITYTSENSFHNILEKGSLLIDNDQFSQGVDFLSRRIKDYPMGSREFSILNSVIAWGYHQLGDKDNETRHYANAAMSDIKGVIKENMAMRALAEMMFEKGDIDRANHYIQKSIDDANYYSARMRKNQSALMLPLVTQTFQIAQDSQQRELTIFLVVTAVLAAGLIVACIFIFRQLKTVKASHRLVSESKKRPRKPQSRAFASRQSTRTGQFGAFRGQRHQRRIHRTIPRTMLQLHLHP